MKKNISPEKFSSELASIDDVTEVMLVASKHDVDY